jgi:hypothetical protein
VLATSGQNLSGKSGSQVAALQKKRETMATINVTVYDSTENKRVPVELPDDAPCNKIIVVLVQKLRLPTNGPDGAPLSYKFHHKNSGKQIQDSQTLGEAGVKDGDILRLQPEITAG